MPPGAVVLNPSQRRAVQEITDHAVRRPQGTSHERVLYGDVGSGKTRVIMQVCRNLTSKYNTSAVVACPTNALVKQHAKSFVEEAGFDDSDVILVTSEEKKNIKEKKAPDDRSVIVVGTHALEHVHRSAHGGKKATVLFVDEHQKFGKSTIDEIAFQHSRKGKDGNYLPPLTVYVSATPIPRTTALAFAADIPVTYIDSRSAETHKRKTSVIKGKLGDTKEIDRQIFLHKKMGGLVILVCPCINSEDDVTDCRQAMDHVLDKLKVRPLDVGVVHGKMKREDLDSEIQRAKNGDTKIIVATSIVEVGIHIPQASLIVILDADRFGVSQLHQMRGRVGRAQKGQGPPVTPTCLIVCKDTDRPAIKALSESGIDNAVRDLVNRGPGDIHGIHAGDGEPIKQHGYMSGNNQDNHERLFPKA